MKKSKKLRIFITILITCIIFISVYFGYRLINVIGADKTWIKDFNYEDNEIHKLYFNSFGVTECPFIPITVGDNEFRVGFDTGCGSGFSLTNAIEDKIDFTYLSQIEALNRDGSHRGWSKNVLIDNLTVFGETYENINTFINDWTMLSSEKFNGLIGLTYFKSKVITLDYKGQRIAVSSNPIDYTNLNPDKYVVLPLYHTTTKGQEDLPFFQALYKNEPVIVYLDTGKNHSYILDENGKYSSNEKPTDFTDVDLTIGTLDLKLKHMTRVNDLAQGDGLPYPVIVELNSDQILKNNLLVTFDLIEQKIIFGKLG
jgi:hypothetical protein